MAANYHRVGHVADAGRRGAVLPRGEEVIMKRVFHVIAGVGPLAFLAVATIEGLFRGGYDPVAQPISALALGPRGWVQALNFAVLTTALLSFAVVLRQQLQPGVSSVAGPGVFLLLSIGMALSGAFRMDAAGTPPSLAGRLHLLGGFLIFPWIPVALLVVARRFRRDPRWRPYFTYTLLTGLYCLAAIAFFLLFVGPPEMPRRYAGFAGLVQRALLFPFLVWIAFVAWRASGYKQSVPSVRQAPIPSQLPVTSGHEQGVVEPGKKH
jgi:hypothetical protein